MWDNANSTVLLIVCTYLFQGPMFFKDLYFLLLRVCLFCSYTYFPNRWASRETRVLIKKRIRLLKFSRNIFSKFEVFQLGWNIRLGTNSSKYLPGRHVLRTSTSWKRETIELSRFWTREPSVSRLICLK